jgi:hypothetical protein
MNQATTEVFTLTLIVSRRGRRNGGGEGGVLWQKGNFIL